MNPRDKGLILGRALTRFQARYNRCGKLSFGKHPASRVVFLREGVERFMITDINNPAASAMSQSEITVYFDQFGPGDNIRWSNHVPGGSNVLYMDGHVEFLKYPNKYPLSRTFMAVFELGL